MQEARTTNKGFLITLILIVLALLIIIGILLYKFALIEKENAYDEGFEAGKLSVSNSDQYDKGYEAGLHEGSLSANSQLENSYKEGYEEGFAKGKKILKVKAINSYVDCIYNYFYNENRGDQTESEIKEVVQKLCDVLPENQNRTKLSDEPTHIIVSAPVGQDYVDPRGN